MLTEGRNPLSQRVSECRRARGRGGVQSGLRSSSLPSWCLSWCGNVYVGAGDKGPLSPTSPLFTGVRRIGILGSSAYSWHSDVFCAMAHIHSSRTRVCCVRYVTGQGSATFLPPPPY